MKTTKNIRSGAIALGVIVMAACSSSDPAPTDPKTSGSPTESATSSPLNGTISGDVTGTVTNGKIVIYGSNPGQTPPNHLLTIDASLQAGSLAFSAPRIGPTGVIASGITFTTPTPVVGTFTNTDPRGVEGDIGMNLEEADGDGVRQYAAHPAGKQGALLGTWKVILTSVTPSDATSPIPLYLVHGSIDATMPGFHTDKRFNTTPGTTSMHLEF
jgi:hypothetical protein